jgi:two-component system, OmpR family, alkaline phosphatase synthesis response regulator PhoP
MDPKSILIVDDEAHILQVVSLKLRNAGFNVTTANDGEEALEVLATTPVDLIITDYQMPGMTGLELARRAHKEPGRAKLPVLLLTAHGLALEQVDMTRAGIRASLSKPFSPREVLHKINALLEECQKASSAAAASPVSGDAVQPAV